jgi:nucleoside-diphosphate-sugar epimerase
METIGFVGIGKIGRPICEHLINKGYRVLGYRRSSLADFAKIGGIPGEIAGGYRVANGSHFHMPSKRRSA